jgi:hypothetical protein
MKMSSKVIKIQKENLDQKISDPEHDLSGYYNIEVPNAKLAVCERHKECRVTLGIIECHSLHWVTVAEEIIDNLENLFNKEIFVLKPNREIVAHIVFGG